MVVRFHVGVAPHFSGDYGGRIGIEGAKTHIKVIVVVQKISNAAFAGLGVEYRLGLAEIGDARRLLPYGVIKNAIYDRRGLCAHRPDFGPCNHIVLRMQRGACNCGA